MNFQLIQPGTFFRTLIKHYCFMESAFNEENVMERVIPTEHIQLMFHYKNPFVVYQANKQQSAQPRSILSGLSHSYSDVSTCGEAGVIFVVFYPGAASHFFPFPLNSVENQSIDLRSVFNQELAIVEEKLFEAKTNKQKINVIEAFLLAHFNPPGQNDLQLIGKGLAIIRQRKGQISAGQLNDCLFTTPKTLERKFAMHVGQTPKQYIKLIRFQETLHDFSHQKQLNLTEYAYRNGYFDQAHFIHDFKAYSGFTPKAFVERYPDFSLEEKQ
jgi:AraC-like DNA-binding protein